MKNKEALKPNRIAIVGIAAAAAIFIGVLIAAVPSKSFSVTVFPKPDKDEIPAAQIPESEPLKTASGITGIPCDERDEPHRPVSIMMAGDHHVRPLSGISKADMVVEMPVVTHGINRLMGVFVCGGEFDIGSVRSSRDDFIPIAAGIDSIYGHWGGSYLALNELNRGVIDNVNAIPNPFGAFFRKSGILAPDNGFTSVERILNAAENLNYSTEHIEEIKFTHQEEDLEQKKDVYTAEIGYPWPFNVRWDYDAETGMYLRSRGGTPEIDALTDEQVSAAAVIVMETSVIQRFGEYNDVKVVGEGEAAVITSGGISRGVWSKSDESLFSPLKIFSNEGEPIPLAKGKLWLEIVQSGTSVTLSPAEFIESFSE